MDVLAVGFEITTHVQDWIATGGPVILFLILFICGLGLPLPEDIPLLTAGALVASGHMELHWAALAGWAGIIGGDLLLYHLGRKFGLEVTRLPFVGKHLTRSRIEHVEKLFDRYGIWVVAVGRLFAGVRGAMVVAAGATRYSRVKFFIVDSLAAIVSGGLFLTLGYWLGSKMPELVRNIDAVKTWLFVALGVAAIGLLGWILWRQKRVVKILDELPEGPEPVESATPKDRQSTNP